MITVRAIAFVVVTLPFLATVEAAQERRRAVPRYPQSQATATAPECVENAARLVDDIYQQVLERPADAASAPLTQGLLSGRLTVRDIVAELAKSREYAERFYWRPVVEAVYDQVMRRPPNPDELRRTAAALAGGELTVQEVIARAAVRATNNENDAVRILYRRLLGREADAEGLRSYTEMAQAEGIEAVARHIMQSPEYVQRVGQGGVNRDAAPYETAVRSLYQHLLGRDPDPIGFRSLTNLAFTAGLPAVVDEILTSREYQQSYGLHVVPGRNVRYCGATR